MGLGSFIAESPGKFLALLGAGTLLAVGFGMNGPVSLSGPRSDNPWALDPDAQPHHSPLDKLKNTANDVGARFGVHFGAVPAPAGKAGKAGDRPRHPRHRLHRAHRKAATEESLELRRRKV